MEQMTEYERKRQENIERNQKMLAALGVYHTAQDLRSTAKKPKLETKGFKISKRKRESEPTIIRRSLRTRGISPETLKGLEVDSPSSKPSHRKFDLITPEVPVSQKNGPISFAETYVEHGGNASNSHCLGWLKDLADDVPLVDLKFRKSSQLSEGGGADYSPGGLKLKSENIVRISPDRIFCVEFLPFRDKVIVVSGDKEGHLSLWDAGCSKEEGDGLHIYCPHSSPISGIAVDPFSLTKVISCSYDGCIRAMDVEKEVFDMVYKANDSIYAICSSSSYQSIYFSEGYGTMKVLDKRVGGVSNSYSLHEKRINSIDFHPQKSHVVSTSSTDGRACIWDLRKMKKINTESLATVQHMRAVHSAYFSPGGDMLATTSYDNKVGLLSGLDSANTDMIYHYNPPRRWISSFRAIWGWDDRYLFIGNLDRGLDAICTESKATTTLSSPLLTTIPTRLAKHPFHCGTLAGGTGGGKVYVWQKM
ncbi:hypothetical protein SUGI_0892570 [Cryptomeria japonica]|uniref:uncharacterized protein LOC131043923 n=1 Tax=Cryptomeria japonica TaxID=3369 RepID=UPI00241499C6|nr:uncharacterized protein LOC131043923 [Cryptomeria japonica]XP_057833141.2 uncharacterized protein LOC131043923 [Cryptomeria japonica]GLJ43008.1 hypothetical protein SUGI_0892570 [Cryptomeria japonica]